MRAGSLASITDLIVMSRLLWRQANREVQRRYGSRYRGYKYRSVPGCLRKKGRGRLRLPLGTTAASCMSSVVRPDAPVGSGAAFVQIC